MMQRINVLLPRLLHHRVSPPLSSSSPPSWRSRTTRTTRASTTAIMRTHLHRFMSSTAPTLPSSSSRTSPAAATTARKAKVPDGPGFEHFVANSGAAGKEARGLRISPPHPYVDEESTRGDGRKVYVDVHGCQMNVSDAEVVWSVLNEKGFARTDSPREADVWLIVTCSIREGAEGKIWRKLSAIKRKRKAGVYRPTMKVGVLGCMAERLKDDLLREADVVAGPDSYRDLPRLLAITSAGDESAINVMLSLEETYADIMPMRLNDDKVTGFVSIQRGCDNMCSYCIVPFTRGRERSRPVSSILDEVRHLADAGVREVTLLGQNVNSYRDASRESVEMYGGLAPDEPSRVSEGFRSIYKAKTGGVRFADLLSQVSEVHPEVRVRFTSPHPKDFPEEVLQLIAERPNVCKNLHLPAQSGNSKVLRDMRRGYTREAYLDLVDRVRRAIPGVTLSTDMIAGFCGETEEEFEDTVSLIKTVKYHQMFMFPYSLREKTHAHRKLVDDVSQEVKDRRFKVLYDLFREEAAVLNQRFVGTRQIVLVEGDSKRSPDWFQGRSDGNIKVNFPKPTSSDNLSPGEYCSVLVTDSTSQSLKGVPVEKTDLRGSPVSKFSEKDQSAAAGT